MKILTAILVVSFLLRVYLCFFIGASPFSTDSFTYLKMADGILEGTPIGFFPNGYPLFIAALKLLVGESLLVDALLVVNVFLSTAIVYFVFMLSKDIAGPGYALIAAVLIAFWPNQLNYSRYLLTEVPSTALLLFAFFALFKEKMLVAGALFAVSSLMRSTLLPVAPIIMIILLAQRGVTSAVYLMVGYAGVLLTEHVVIMLGIAQDADNLSANLLVAISARSSEGVDYSASGFTEMQRQNALVTYIQFAIEAPKEFMLQRVSALWELWGPWPNQGAADDPRSALERVLIGSRTALLLLGIYGFLIVRVRWQGQALVIPVLVITSVHFFFFATSRFTFPVEPFLAVLCSAAFQRRFG